jgi:hypothetical protein
MSLSVWSNRHRPNAPATHPIMQTRRRVLGKPCLESWATWGFSSPDSKSKEPNDCATNRGQQQGSVNNSQRVKGVKGVKGVKPYICIILFIRPCLFALEGLCSKCSGFPFATSWRSARWSISTPTRRQHGVSPRYLYFIY